MRPNRTVHSRFYELEKKSSCASKVQRIAGQMLRHDKSLSGDEHLLWPFCWVGGFLWSRRQLQSPRGSAFCETPLLFTLAGAHVTIRPGWSWTARPRRRASPSRPSGSWSTTGRRSPPSTCTAPPGCARCQCAANYCLWVNSEPFSHGSHFNKANMYFLELCSLTVDCPSLFP